MAGRRLFALLAGWRSALVARSRRLVRDRFGLVLGAVAAFAGVLVLTVATQLFPYHSVNHDEGVYLQQAAMLLDGKLVLRPPVPDAVRPWFFVQDGGRLYSKYSPVAPAMFAPALALGVPRLSLALVAAGIAGLVGLLGAEAFDRPTGLCAAALVLTAPLFVYTSSTFLSYAPTTLLNLLFALGYVRAVRRESLRYAALAGLAVGLAFFARPFTAVLFAAPFVCHACLTLAAELARRDRLRGALARLGTVGTLGTLFVGVTLAYNWLLTGDPLVFPYQAFAPEDGIGFGHHQILGHERNYTPALALRANSRVLWNLLARWGPLGALGTMLAAVGCARGLLLTAWRDRPSLPRIDRLSDVGARALLAGVFASVAVGNVYFWGNLNVLAAVDDPTDGLVAHLGPFYHFDALLPLAVFGAAGLVTLARGLVAALDRVESWEIGPVSGRTVAHLGLAFVVVASVALAGSTVATTFGPPAERNAAYTDDLSQIYEPFEDPPEDALVYTPTPYGPWLQHPFQWLRNDPKFESGPVFVMDRGPTGDFESLAAFPERRPYRFTYRGDWPPDGDEALRPVLEPLTVKRGERISVRTRVGVVARAQGATVRIAADGEAVQYGVTRLPERTLSVAWVVGPDGARVRGDGLRRFGTDGSVPVDGPTTVTLTVTFTQPGGATVTYRQELTVRARGGRVTALWPPETRVCKLTSDCGREGTYVPGGDYVTGVSLSTNATAVARGGDASVES